MARWVVKASRVLFCPNCFDKLKQIFNTRHFSTPLKVMASSADLSKKQFKKSMTKKSHSWWWDSHNCPKNSKWLSQNLEKMDDRVKHMLKLIEEDADSFAKKAQMYYQKRPELIHLVEEFYRMYRALAERYDQASGELQKIHLSGIQPQGSLEKSSPTSQEKSSHPHKEEEDSSSLSDSDSDSKSVPDHSSVNDEDGDEALIRRMADLELELQETKEKLHLQQERLNGDNNTDLLQKITVYEGELKEANVKIRMQEKEIANLKIELKSCISSEAETQLGVEQESLDLVKEETKDAGATLFCATTSGGIALSKKQFKRSTTKKSHSWWWDSHNCPKNSKWLAENLEKMDDRVKHMLKLIEEDADSFAKKAQMYYQKRPELIHLVEEFYRMYRALAERYDQASGELQKNQQSQGSLDQPSPTSSRRHKDEEESSSLTDSGSDSDSVHDHSSASDEDGDEALIRRMAELELELQETKQKLLLQQECDNGDTLLQKITVYEGELREANEQIRMQEEEIANLKVELQSCMSSGAEEKLKLAQNDADTLRNKLNAEKKEVSKLVERLAMVKTSLQDRDNEVRSLKTAVSDAEEKIFPEKAQIKGEMSKLVEERSQVGEQLRELESHVRLITEEKAGIEEKLKGESEKLSVMKDESNVLRDEIGKREEKIKEMEKHMKELHMEQVRLRRRSSELAEEVERTRVAASEVADQKREAIRQLCMSLDYYKDGYERLWNVVAGHKRGVVLAS
ncbi:hypothetical protein IGI04_010173 [Brassica rapa subsp. trilocularis]|uniref:NAB domain-containing protein n=1 Tax=Brassica rapa subsp. trilocularis TaxID=1813537 RepID=A0ABQ7N2S2_BRACM|nr:hypothetical protein IGI04_010173 [Brassica rapa subsp. trilocularis]